MPEKSRPLFFFIGTEAELIKIFPVIMEAKKVNMETHIISSGQNDIDRSEILEKTDCGEIDLKLSEEKTIRKSALGLMKWWVRTYRKGVRTVRVHFGANALKGGYMIVHGDTVSTCMGAWIGWKLGMTVCHIEAGLRSHHLFNPFPEEIDRLLTGRLARLHFAPGDAAVANLAGAKGRIINTGQNTLLDSLRISQEFPVKGHVKEIIESKIPYFVFVMHRQENLINGDFVRAVIAAVKKVSENCRAVIVAHRITENALVKFGLYEDVSRNANIRLIPRTGYFDFMKLLKEAEFVITDGGSNQEELYYMGKPALILRRTTERNEGIGMNARLFNGNVSDIEAFAAEQHILRTERPGERVSPTQIIITELMQGKGAENNEKKQSTGDRRSRIFRFKSM